MLLGISLVLLGGGSALAAGGLDTFRVPSGNIFCAFEHDGLAPVDLRCEIRTKLRPLPPRPSVLPQRVLGSGVLDAAAWTGTGPLQHRLGLRPEGAGARVRGDQTIRRVPLLVERLRPAVPQLDRQRVLPQQAALVLVQGAGEERLVQDPVRNIVAWLLDRAGRLGVRGVRDQERPEAAAEADPLRRRRPERPAREPARHRARDSRPVRRRPWPAPPAVRGKGERARLRLEHANRDDHVLVGHGRSHVPQPRRPRLLPEPRELAGLLVTDLVLDGDQVEAPRRRGRASLRAWASGEQLRDLRRLPFDHRPDERAHHVAEEAVGGDLELERIASEVPGGILDLALEDRVLGLGRRERPEIVLSQDQIGRFGEPRLVNRPGKPPAAPLLER